MPILSRRTKRNAGVSARAQFRNERKRVLRKNWRDWVVLAAIAAASLATTILAEGVLQVIASLLFGFTVAIAMVGWIIGGEVHSLRYVWGSIGEEATAEALRGLDGDSWWVTHDVPWRYGNFDHIVVGPPGVFVLDSKRLFSRARVENDELRSGNMRYKGSRFRGAARALHEALAPEAASKPWVQAVVVVWEDLDHEMCETERVVYVEGRSLVPWLESQAPKRTEERRAELAAAVERLRSESASAG